MVTNIFRIQSSLTHGNVNFRLFNDEILSRNASGILGTLTRPGAYKVVQTAEKTGQLLRAIDSTTNKHVYYYCQNEKN